jgi:hypothetical protein
MADAPDPKGPRQLTLFRGLCVWCRSFAQRSLQETVAAVAAKLADAEEDGEQAECEEN